MVTKKKNQSRSYLNHLVCNTYLFSTATMVVRTRFNVTLYVHWLSCLFHDTDKVDTWRFHRNSLRHYCRYSYFSKDCQRPSATREQEHVFLPGKSSLLLLQPLAHGIPLWIVTGVKCPRGRFLTFRHRASCILGQTFHYSPENAFYIFNQQIYFIIWYLLDRASLI